MPLTINLKPHEKLILNGVVIENSGPMAKILIHTTAALLREKDVLPEEQATTPARRIYFAIQCRYLFAGKADRLPVSIDRLLADYAAARPEERPVLDEIRRLLAQEQYYRALKIAKQLIRHEDGDDAGPPSAPDRAPSPPPVG